MSERKRMLSQLLDQMADELNITQTMYDKAVRSYEAVGNWLGEMEQARSVHCYPQGSFNLGTVVRPLTDEDDGYDIDLVCAIYDGVRWSEAQIKRSVGDRLKENATYKDGMLDEEGKRCWTLQYAGFHMDILPCAPYQIPSAKIRLTHKNENGTYSPRYSNPTDYRTWFIDRMQMPFERELKKGLYAQADIADVPLYSTRTPLQKAIQLLKRHRDIMFESDASSNGPASIIITTLAAKSYENEIDLYSALSNIIEKIPQHVHRIGDKYSIPNPVMQQEDFADKWNQDSSKAQEFFLWLGKVKQDILETPLTVIGIDNVANALGRSLGETITKRALNAIGEEFTVERRKANLFADGLVGGITVGKGSNKSKKIGEHTFFGGRKETIDG